MTPEEQRTRDIMTVADFIIQTVNDSEWPKVCPNAAPAAFLAFKRLFPKGAK